MQLTASSQPLVALSVAVSDDQVRQHRDQEEAHHCGSNDDGNKLLGEVSPTVHLCNRKQEGWNGKCFRTNRRRSRSFFKISQIRGSGCIRLIALLAPLTPAVCSLTWSKPSWWRAEGLDLHRNQFDLQLRRQREHSLRSTLEALSLRSFEQPATDVACVRLV